MVVAVSIVVTVKDVRLELDAFIESMDRQSLSTDAFEVVFTDLGSTDETLNRLHVLTEHRPNLRLVETVDDNPTAVASVALNTLEHCSGKYVMRLRVDQLLYPDALERMYEYAVQYDLDAVAGRYVQPGVAVPTLFTSDTPSVGPELSAVALASPAVLARRGLAAAAANSSTVALPDLPKVGILASYPALQEPGTGRPANAGAVLTPGAPSISWVNDQLVVELAGRATNNSAVNLTFARTLGLLRHVSSGLTYLLSEGEPLSPSVGDAALDYGWRLNLGIDVRKAGNGGPLAPGLWEVDVQLLGLDIESSPVTVGWSACQPAVIGGVMIVPSPVQTPTWQLDIGPTVWPVVADPEPAGASVVESAAGALLVLQLPTVHVSGQATIDGEIALERLLLAAKVISDGSTARLESFVSGLAGAPRIATRFGEVPMKQTGLVLRIAGDGRMDVVKYVPPPAKPAAVAPTPPPKVAPKPPAKKTAAPPTTPPPVKKAAAQKQTVKKVPDKEAPTKKAAKRAAPVKPPTTLQKIRRRLPSSLEPLAKRVAKNPAARDLYRRIAKL